MVVALNVAGRRRRSRGPCDAAGVTSDVVLGLLAVLGLALVLSPIGLQAFVLSRARRAQLVSEPAEVVPGGGWPLSGAMQALGFQTAGAMRVVAPTVPEQHCLLFVHPDLASFARLWVGPDGKTGGYSIQSPIAGGTLCTGMDAVDAVDDRELLQVFPGADPQELLRRHVEAQWFLAGLGVEGRPVAAADADGRFRAEWAAELEQVARRGWRFTVSSAYRSALKLPRWKGPLAEQRDIHQRVQALRARGAAEPPAW